MAATLASLHRESHVVTQPLALSFIPYMKDRLPPVFFYYIQKKLGVETGNEATKLPGFHTGL